MAHRNVKYVDKFKLPKMFEYTKISMLGLPRNWDKPRQAFLHSPKSLVELVTDVLDSQPLPDCIYWPNSRVLEWLENTLHLPEYKNTFMVNLITGRHLILVSPNHLIKMNIHIWDHIKKILVGIRELYQVPMPRFARDLTKPILYVNEYDWETLYYRYIAPMTPGLAITRSKYWRLAKMITTKPEPVCHWYSMQTEQDSHDKVVIARVNKKKRERLFVPMFSENHFIPTTIFVYYLDGDPLGL